MPSQNEVRANEWARVQAYFDSKKQKTGLLQSNQGMGDESVMDPINAGNAEGQYRQHEYMMVKGQLLRFEIPTEGERPNTFDAFAQDGTKYTITVEKVDRANLNTPLSTALREQFTRFKDEVKTDFNTAEMIFSFSTPFAVESQNSVGGKSYEYFKIERNVPVADDVRLPSEVAISAARAPLPPHKNEVFLNQLDKQLKQNQLELDKTMAELEKSRKEHEKRARVRESEKPITDDHPARKNTPQQSLAKELSPEQIAALAPHPPSIDMDDEVEISDELPSKSNAGFAPQRRSSNMSEQRENRGISEKVEKLSIFQRIRIAINNVIGRIFPSPNERKFNEFISKLESQADDARGRAKVKLSDPNLVQNYNAHQKYKTEAEIKWYFTVEDLKTLKGFITYTNQLGTNDRFKNRVQRMYDEVTHNILLDTEFKELDTSQSTKNESRKFDKEKAGDSRKSVLRSFPKFQSVPNEFPSHDDARSISSSSTSESKSKKLPNAEEHHSQAPQKNVDPSNSSSNRP